MIAFVLRFQRPWTGPAYTAPQAVLLKFPLAGKVQQYPLAGKTQR